jgi:hypothetical protein
MTTTINAGNNGMDYSQVAYKLAAITELIGTPEEARELSQDAFSGIRIGLEESAELLLSVNDRSGYKLLAVAALMETPEQAKEISPDAWSGARLIIEDVSEYLLNA